MSGLRVERVDCLVLVQDRGRPGWAHLGVPPSGALDPAAMALANRLVGNAEDAAGLENLLGGVVLAAEGSLRLALTGAQLLLRVGGGAAPWGTAVSVPDGQRVEVGRSSTGLRGWLAVGGGVEVPPVLGSRSTDTLSGLGPEPLRVGDLLPLGRLGPVVEHEGVAVPMSLPAPGDAVLLQVRPGPRDDWFTESSMADWWGSELVVTPAADRVAVRLHGKPLVRRDIGELPSEGLVTGAVQVPGDGQPLVFLADRPTTGGYPVVGVIDAVGVARCAQLRPGDRVRLIPAR